MVRRIVTLMNKCEEFIKEWKDIRDSLKSMQDKDLDEKELNMIFSKRKELSEEFCDWKHKYRARDTVLNVITFLDSKGLLKDGEVPLTQDLYLDPYLQPGWPCEITPPNGNKCLRYFAKVYYDGNPIFVERIIQLDTPFKTMEQKGYPYRPIGTEVSFIPEGINDWYIDINGWVNIKGYGKISMKTVLPTEYYGTTIQRPEWAKA